MVLQNAGYPGGGMAYSHSVPPVARYCTPCCIVYPGTTQAEGRDRLHTAAGEMRFWVLPPRLPPS